MIKVKARITGLGSYLPERILSNKDLESMVETSDEWIFSRTGMKERRLAAPNESTSDMGLVAAKIAMNAANISVDQIDFIIVATATPDYVMPSTAAIIQASLGATHAGAIDIQAACSGFIYALTMAKAFVEAKIYRRVLIVASEKMSSFVDYKDRNTCVLFGDGAAAAVVSFEGAGLEIHSTCLGADGSLAEILMIPAGGARNPTSIETVEKGLHTIKMTGKETFKHAVRRMKAAAVDCLKMANLNQEDIQWLVPHQANLRIIDAIADDLKIPHKKVYKTVHKYGNTSSSGIAIALNELVEENPLNNGDHLLLVAFGAGFTWGACILTKVDEVEN